MINLDEVANTLDRGDVYKARLSYEGGPEGSAPLWIIGVEGERVRVVRAWFNEPMTVLAESLEAA